MNFHIQDHDREIRTSYWRVFNFEILKIPNFNLEVSKNWYICITSYKMS
jgi:uncharacterized protein YxjI